MVIPKLSETFIAFKFLLSKNINIYILLGVPKTSDLMKNLRLTRVTLNLYLQLEIRIKDYSIHLYIISFSNSVLQFIVSFVTYSMSKGNFSK